MELMARWRVAIIGAKGQRFERLGTVEAADQRKAYRLAIEKFNVPIERQSRLFVSKSDEKT
jgi:1,2-phenylacetyl-CoA epoxidase PaaB subunit